VVERFDLDRSTLRGSQVTIDECQQPAVHIGTCATGSSLPFWYKTSTLTQSTPYLTIGFSFPKQCLTNGRRSINFWQITGFHSPRKRESSFNVTR
jgi:hypothetical protein